MPKTKFFISSLDNAYGVYDNQWWDGNKILIDFDKYTYWKQIVVKQEKHVYLKSLSKCNNYTFAECHFWHLLMDDFKDCPRKCTNIPNLNETKNWKTEHNFRE